MRLSEFREIGKRVRVLCWFESFINRVALSRGALKLLPYIRSQFQNFPWIEFFSKCVPVHPGQDFGSVLPCPPHNQCLSLSAGDRFKRYLVGKETVCQPPGKERKKGGFPDVVINAEKNYRSRAALGYVGEKGSEREGVRRRGRKTLGIIDDKHRGDHRGAERKQSMEPLFGGRGGLALKVIAENGFKEKASPFNIVRRRCGKTEKQFNPV
ncbi:MAG: hypothetical protein VX633_04745 [Verrucomicrobiota bacterium]|nr:hypothetical protein [Verrucomicrobiota bacterium]